MSGVIAVKSGAGSSVIGVGPKPTRAVIAAGLRGSIGPTGDQGAPFQVDEQGTLAERSAYDSEPVNFAYLATDNGYLYFREGPPGGWSDGVMFQGPPGANGADGADGLDGADGTDGTDGRSVVSSVIDGDGHLILSYSDSTQADVGIVVGADGANGAGGANGANGLDGADGADGRGIASVAIDGSGHLIITYTDATTEDAGLVSGGGSSAWGAITGTLTDQADLVAALGGKVDTQAGYGLSENDYTDAEKAKLGGVATGATANDTDVNLKNRANHTGTQAASTISDLTEVTQDMVGAMIVAGSNISLAYDDTAGTLTISSTGGGGSGGIAPESIVAGEALTTGQYVNVYADSGTTKARKAGGSGKYPAHGFVKAGFAAAATASVYPLAAGNDALSSLTIGTTYFLSTSTAGAVQATAPATTGVLRQELGVAISATELLPTNSIPVELV